ncbi:MAG: hypothetical protein ACYCPW_07395 [Nitrososphaerales archaeon]
MSKLRRRIVSGRKNRGKKAVSSILGGILVFGILFTVGLTYFTTAQQDYKNLSTVASQKIQEQFSITVETASDGNLAINVSNTGSITIAIASIVVTNETAAPAEVFAIAASPTTLDTSSPQLSPTIAINPGNSSYATLKGQSIDTHVKYDSPDMYKIQVITQRGSIQTAIFPQPQTSSDLAYQALTSGALGDLYLSFNSYTYYQIQTCNSSSGYCLATPGSLAFTIPSSLSTLAISITMTDLNAQHASIVLDQFTLIYQNSFYGDQNLHVNLIPWYVVSNQSNKLLNTYTPIILNYSVPTTVVFASTTCVTAAAGPNFGNPCSTLRSAGIQSPNMNPGTISTVFIMTHGWELAPPISLSSLSYSSANYGQNLPYVSTLYT